MEQANNSGKSYGVLPNQCSLRKPKKALTLAERISVIQLYETVRNTRKLATIFGCGRTQIQNILKRKEEYLDEWALNGCENRMRIRYSARLTTLGAIVYEWVQRARCYGLQLTEETVRQTGQEIANVLQMPEFRPTTTWYNRVRQKYKMFDLGPSSFFNDPNVPRKSLNIKDIILDLKDPKCKNFVLLPKCTSFDPLGNLGGNAENFTIHQESTDYEEEEVEIMYNAFRNDMEIEVIKEEEDYDSDLSSSTFTKGTDLISFIENKEMPLVMESQDDEVATVVTTKDANMESLEKHEEDLISIIHNKNVPFVAQSQDEDFVTVVENTDENLKHLESYRDALKYLKPLEEFALYKTNVRAVGLINQLENLFKENLSIADN